MSQKNLKIKVSRHLNQENNRYGSHDNNRSIPKSRTLKKSKQL